jgi:hypothetical protein
MLRRMEIVQVFAFDILRSIYISYRTKNQILFDSHIRRNRIST